MGWLPKASPFFVFYVLVCLEHYALNVAGNQGSTGDFLRVDLFSREPCELI